MLIRLSYRFTYLSIQRATVAKVSHTYNTKPLQTRFVRLQNLMEAGSKDAFYIYYLPLQREKIN